MDDEWSPSLDFDLEENIISIGQLKRFIKEGLLFFAMILFLVSGMRADSFWGYDKERLQYLKPVWNYALDGFETKDYREGLDWIIGSFEEKTGRALRPGEMKRVALKVYTNSGRGVNTPKSLTKALIDFLLSRGFKAENLYIVDVSANNLRLSGYLPKLSEHKPALFHGVPVVALDDGAYWDSEWFYENPLPVQFHNSWSQELLSRSLFENTQDERQSYLPSMLIHDVDFWINLPVVTDHPAYGVNGAIANASLWNISNRDRFFLSPANAPVAMAEIFAIPELISGLALNILSLENYQAIGGPQYNAHYCRSEKRLWASVDPVVLDSMMRLKMNEVRRENRLPELIEYLPMFEYAYLLQIGNADMGRHDMISPDSAK